MAITGAPRKRLVAAMRYVGSNPTLSATPNVDRMRWKTGEVSEWLKERAWKACLRATVTWVRIPPSPPDRFYMGLEPRMV